MRVHFCGVRGSTPAPGAPFVRYGGHTSCVALAHDGLAPTLVLDAGTGLQRLSELLGDQPFRGAILLGHLHWDHTHGLPFFASGSHPDARVDLRLPEQGDAAAVLARAFSPPHFPITLADLPGRWTCSGLEAGQHCIERFTVLALDLPHPGGRSLGFRVSDGAATVAYLSDHGPSELGEGPDGLGPYHDAARRLAQGADLLIHDAQYTTAEWPARRAFGHSTIDYAVGLARVTGVRTLALFHHDPGRSDEALDIIAAEHGDGSGPGIIVAAEGTTVDLPGIAGVHDEPSPY